MGIQDKMLNGEQTFGANRWQHDPIAIVGIACPLPGGINNPRYLWNLVNAKGSTTTDIPSDRFNLKGFFSPNPSRSGSLAMSRGHFIDRDLRDFDHRFFGINKEDADSMDQQHKQLVEVVYECLESAGIPMERIKGTKTGCYCAMFSSDYHDMQIRDPEYCAKYIGTGDPRCFLANRISYVFDIRGPRCVPSLSGSSQNLNLTWITVLL